MNVNVGVSSLRKFLIGEKNAKKMIWRVCMMMVWHIYAGASCLGKAYFGNQYKNWCKVKKQKYSWGICI